jgi:Fe-S-cluster formation regulator IscX/YfhJ
MISLESDHPLSAAMVQRKLADDLDFRARLNFEMEDVDVRVDGRNLSFLVDLRPFPGHVRIFQNNQITWFEQDTILTVKYLFGVSGRSIKVELRRKISPTSDASSSSVVTIELKVNECSDEFGSAALAFIERRSQTENRLLSLFQISDALIADPSDLPLDISFTGIRDGLEDLNRLLDAHPDVDPAITEAIAEIHKFHRNINRSRERLLDAIRIRNALHNAVKAQSEQVAALAAEIELARPRDAGVDESNHCLTLAVSLVPIVAGLIWMFFKKRKH